MSSSVAAFAEERQQSYILKGKSSALSQLNSKYQQQNKTDREKDRDKRQQAHESKRERDTILKRIMEWIPVLFCVGKASII